jgi:aspartate/methionine/tyrosine aminotransferase
MILSKRINKINESGIRRIFELAVKNKGEYINLSIGQPHFKVPDKLKSAAKTAIENDINSYTPTLGYPAFIDNIKNKLIKENNINAQDGEIIVTSGVSGAIFLLLSSIIDPGDEVIITDPYFVMYKEILTFLDAKIIYLDTYPTFHIDQEMLHKSISHRTKAMILNSPNNPTGAVYDEIEIRSVANIAREKNILIISDEIYEKFDYDKKFFSIGSIYDNTVTLNGFSKSHALTGWRVGYAHAPKEIISAMNKLQQYTFVCAPSFAQASLASEEDFETVGEIVKYKAKRDFVYSELEGKFELTAPQGAFYAFIRIPDGKNDFVEELIRNKVLVVPGGSFSRRNDYFRISFSVDNDILHKGIEIIKRLG